MIVVKGKKKIIKLSIEILIGRLILTLLTTLLLMSVLYGIAILVGVLLQLMEIYPIVTIIIFLFDFYLFWQEFKKM